MLCIVLGLAIPFTPLLVPFAPYGADLKSRLGSSPFPSQPCFPKLLIQSSTPSRGHPHAMHDTAGASCSSPQFAQDQSAPADVARLSGGSPTVGAFPLRITGTGGQTTDGLDGNMCLGG